jgi:hypothetical protein
VAVSVSVAEYTGMGVADGLQAWSFARAIVVLTPAEPSAFSCPPSATPVRQRRLVVHLDYVQASKSSTAWSLRCRRQSAERS